jgi:hypothetical protein
LPGSGYKSFACEHTKVLPAGLQKFYIQKERGWVGFPTHPFFRSLLAVHAVLKRRDPVVNCRLGGLHEVDELAELTDRDTGGLRALSVLYTERYNTILDRDRVPNDLGGRDVLTAAPLGDTVLTDLGKSRECIVQLTVWEPLRTASLTHIGDELHHHLTLIRGANTEGALDLCNDVLSNTGIENRDGILGHLIYP